MTIKIRIVDSVSEFSRMIDEKIANDTLDKPLRGMVMTPETFCQIFSPERIKLLKRIRKNHVSNIYQLAKEMDKPYEVVFRNIKYLEGMGLIKLVRKENKMIPHLACRLTIDMEA